MELEYWRSVTDDDEVEFILYVSAVAVELGSSLAKVASPRRNLSPSIPAAPKELLPLDSWCLSLSPLAHAVSATQQLAEELLRRDACISLRFLRYR